MPENIQTLLEQAKGFLKNKKWDQAIEIYSRILSLVKNNLPIDDDHKASIYFKKGVAHGGKGDYERAITDFKEAVELKSDYAVAYVGLGIAYLFKEKTNYRHAKEKFDKANQLDPISISKNPYCYIAYKVDSVYMFEHLSKLYAVVSLIKRLLIHPKKQNLIAHYTDLDSLKKLVQDPSFRLYNATYMNDPEEGKTLLEELWKLGLPNKDDTENFFLSGSKRSPAYIGSFVEASEELGDEKLFLWRTYGKHRGQEAGGACLYFGISQFSGRPLDQLEGMRLISSEHSTTPQRECIYGITYKSDIESNNELKTLLQKLAEALNNIGSQGWDEDNTGHQLAREILDEIRFLFKADHYREEKELRIVKILYSVSEQTNDVKVDNHVFPPRFYTEAPPQLQLKKIMLGPQARGFLEWKSWIKTKNNGLEIKQSATKYGGGYF